MVQEYLKVEEGLHENPDYLWNKAKVTAQYIEAIAKDIAGDGKFFCIFFKKI